MASTSRGHCRHSAHRLGETHAPTADRHQDARTEQAAPAHLLRQSIVSLGIYTALYGTSQWMEGAAHYTASQVGLILLPLSVIGGIGVTVLLMTILDRKIPARTDT